MKTRWTHGLESQKASDIKQKFMESSLLRKRLITMISDIIEEKRKSQVFESLYESPNWSYIQADRVGYERALRDVMELLS